MQQLAETGLEFHYFVDWVSNQAYFGELHVWTQQEEWLRSHLSPHLSPSFAVPCVGEFYWRAMQRPAQTITRESVNGMWFPATRQLQLYASNDITEGGEVIDSYDYAIRLSPDFKVGIGLTARHSTTNWRQALTLQLKSTTPPADLSPEQLGKLELMHLMHQWRAMMRATIPPPLDSVVDSVENKESKRMSS